MELRNEPCGYQSRLCTLTATRSLYFNCNHKCSDRSCLYPYYAKTRIGRVAKQRSTQGAQPTHLPCACGSGRRTAPTHSKRTRGALTFFGEFTSQRSALSDQSDENSRIRAPPTVAGRQRLARSRQVDDLLASGLRARDLSVNIPRMRRVAPCPMVADFADIYGGCERLFFLLLARILRDTVKILWW